jgi:hypothetical protein
LVAYADQLVRLDELMAAGKGDASEADVIRDELDGYWTRMSPEELEIARQLSADLYTLHDDSIVRHPSEFNVYAPQLAAELARLTSSGSYLQALRLIQDRAGDISKERASLFRAILYRSLGLPEIGLIFFHSIAAPMGPAQAPSIPLVDFLWQHASFDSATVAS